MQSRVHGFYMNIIYMNIFNDLPLFVVILVELMDAHELLISAFCLSCIGETIGATINFIGFGPMKSVMGICIRSKKFDVYFSKVLQDANISIKSYHFILIYFAS